MKLYVTDPYDEKLLIRGFCAQLIFMQSDIYDYIFNFTFKRSLKGYVYDFCEQYNFLATDAEFFLRTRDRYVVHAVNNLVATIKILIIYLLDLLDELRKMNCRPYLAKFN